MKRGHPSLVMHFFNCHPCELEPSLVAVIGLVTRKCGPDMLRDKFRQQTQLRLTFHQPFLGLFALSNVPADALELDQPALLIKDASFRPLLPANLAVRQYDSVL